MKRKVREALRLLAIPPDTSHLIDEDILDEVHSGSDFDIIELAIRWRDNLGVTRGRPHWAMVALYV